MITNVSRAWIVACAVTTGLIVTPSESFAQVRAWHTYSFVDSPAYTSGEYVTNWTAYRPYSWTAYRPLSWTSYRPYGPTAYRPYGWTAFRPLRNWWASRPLLNWTVARPLYPTVASGACNTCQTTTVSYVPQTTYRTEYVDVPVTTYQPVTACDACGRAVTTYRPITTTTRQTRRVPVTTYRPVYTYYNPCDTGVNSFVPATDPSARFTPAPTLDSATPPPTFDLKKVPTEAQPPTLDPEVDGTHDNKARSTHGPPRQLPRLIDPQDRTATRSAAPSVQTASLVARQAPQGVEVIRWRPAPAQ